MQPIHAKSLKGIRVKNKTKTWDYICSGKVKCNGLKDTTHSVNKSYSTCMYLQCVSRQFEKLYLMAKLHVTSICESIRSIFQTGKQVLIGRAGRRIHQEEMENEASNCQLSHFLLLLLPQCTCIKALFYLFQRESV